MSDAQLSQQVTHAIFLDPELSEEPLEVTSRDGVVRLEGVVQSHARRLRALEIATSFVGVNSVVDRLEVDPPPIMPDEEIAEGVRRDLAVHDGVRKSTISVAARAGVVTLSGTVRTAWDRTRAENVALGSSGVRAVRNLILVDVPGQIADEEVWRTMRSALISQLGDAAAGLRVTVAMDTAVVSGDVVEPWHREKAEEIIRTCRVSNVRNEIRVSGAMPVPQQDDRDP